MNVVRYLFLFGFTVGSLSTSAQKDVLQKRASMPSSLNTVSTDRPNILWIVCEDMSPHLGSYGEQLAKTPQLDQLAKDGVRYTNAFTTAGVCAPSRASIITGCMQTSLGAMHMRTLAVSGPAKDAYPKGFKPYSAVPSPEVKCFPELLRAAGYYCTNNAKEDYQFNAPPTVWDESSNKAHWRNRTSKSQPFFSVFNLNVTHESQVWARSKEPLLVDPAKVVVPPYYPDDSISRHVIARFLSNVMEMDRQAGKIIQQLKDDGLYNNTIVFFYSDHGDGLPYAKRELYDRGLRVPLIIKAPFLEAGSTDNQLISFLDLAPTVLSLAGLNMPGYMEGQAFLGQQKAAVPRKYILAARDRMDSEYDRVRAVGDGRYKYFKNYMPEKPYYQHVLYRLQNPLMPHLLDLRAKGKLNKEQSHWFRPSKPEEELFDTWSDPWEMHDLSADSAHQIKLLEFRTVHEKWYLEHRDWSAVNELEMVSSWWKGADSAPVTDQPVVKRVKGKLVASCSTAGASIGYRKSETGAWMVYTEEVNIPKSETIYFIAQRIGFLPSSVTRFVP